MSSHQQRQTLAHFGSGARQWRENAEAIDSLRVNIIAQRNRVVLRVLQELPGARRLLDVGCGTGELVVAAGRAGLEAIGIDFASEMIALCEELRAREAPGDVRFVQASAFDYEPTEPFDIVSAQGFVEYISRNELAVFLRRSAEMIRPAGALVLGSRNRLFNVFSLNAFTVMERNLGTLLDLLDEAVAIASTADPAEGVRAAQARARVLPQPEQHPRTGVDVSTRHQYTPGELCALLGQAGFQVNRLYPVHYHALPPAAAKDWPAVHVQVSNAVYELATADPRLIPFSSSFVVDARRR